MDNIKRHKFNGTVHDIDLDSFYGYCEEPHPTRPTLHVDWDSLSEKEALRVSIHEALHACNWAKSEEEVDRTSRDIARFLSRLGFKL